MRNPFALRPGRLTTAPRLRIVRSGGRRSELAIDGLVCAVCAVRSEHALRRVPGVRGARVDLARGRATIEHGAGPPRETELAAALDGVVLARGWRHRLESWTTRLRRAA